MVAGGHVRSRCAATVRSDSGECPPPIAAVTPTLVTMDVQLRSLRVEDAAWIHEACQDAAIQEWTTVPRPYLRQHAHEFVATASADSTWVIAVDGHGVGTIGVHVIDPVSRVAEFGYWIAPHSRRQGAASRAIEHLADVLRSRGVRAMRAVIADGNEASQRTVAAAGFRMAADDVLASRNGQPAAGHAWQRELS